MSHTRRGGADQSPHSTPLPVCGLSTSGHPHAHATPTPCRYTHPLPLPTSAAAAHKPRPTATFTHTRAIPHTRAKLPKTQAPPAPHPVALRLQAPTSGGKHPDAGGVGAGWQGPGRHPGRRGCQVGEHRVWGSVSAMAFSWVPSLAFSCVCFFKEGVGALLGCNDSTCLPYAKLLSCGHLHRSFQQVAHSLLSTLDPGFSGL
eukprot:365643-Chlamydomonas_euryale.AAC.27